MVAQCSTYNGAGSTIIRVTSDLGTRLKDVSQYGLASEQYRRALRFILKDQSSRGLVSDISFLLSPVPSTHDPERYFSDIYVCSYTPTLRAFIESRTPLAPRPANLQRSLLVGQPDASLPGVWKEMEVVQGLPIPVTTLSPAHATRQAVAEGLQSHHLIHFACYATLEFGKPLEADIKLHGEDRLTLLDIARSRLPSAEFAFLSACHTAEPTDGDDPTEGLNIAAAMQYHGFGRCRWDHVGYGRYRRKGDI
ncbi:hypothetical protein EDB86DRAFT_2893443 [Lactarius hatsudake]|nr:hypothetical protein EDB86DRAFT_2893443 [Lactarius hatsudake]